MASVKPVCGSSRVWRLSGLRESSRVLRLSKNVWEFLMATSVKPCLVLEESFCQALCGKSGDSVCQALCVGLFGDSRRHFLSITVLKF
jgi:hypothetical protein